MSSDAGAPMLTLLDEGRIFARAEVFGHISEARLRQLAFASQRFAFADGEMVFCRGDEGGAGYLILEGEAEVTTPSGEAERVLGVVGPGFMLGDGALITGAPYLVSARARGRLTVLRVARLAFLDLLDGDRAALGGLLASLAERNARIERELAVKLE